MKSNLLQHGTWRPYIFNFCQKLYSSFCPSFVCSAVEFFGKLIFLCWLQVCSQLFILQELQPVKIKSFQQPVQILMQYCSGCDLQRSSKTEKPPKLVKESDDRLGSMIHRRKSHWTPLSLPLMLISQICVTSREKGLCILVFQGKKRGAEKFARFGSFPSIIFV